MGKVNTTSTATASARPEFLDDTRDISVLWIKALERYNKNAEIVITASRFRDTQAMIDFGNEELTQFRFFRHGDEKIARLRGLFMQNINAIEEGSKQLLSAAAGAFPPAIAISTAMTFVLSAFKSVSADYDVITNFFEDMNSFLQRVSIIEKRVPRKTAYQRVLMDVFVSLLQLCAVARKFIVQKRFKKWIINAVFGEDKVLEADRKQLDISLSRLKDATEFAILDNSENILDRQILMANSLSELHQELRQNEKVHERLTANQNAALKVITDDLQELKENVKRLLSFQQASGGDGTQGVISNEESSANAVRVFIKDDFGRIPDMSAFLRSLERSHVKGTGSWLFENPVWLAWENGATNSPALFSLEGGSGVGKTYLSLAIYQHLCRPRTTEHEACVVYFSCRKDDANRSSMRSAMINFAIQVLDQNPALHRIIQAKLRDERAFSKLQGVENNIELLYDFFVYKLFAQGSKFQLLIVFDGTDELGNDGEVQQFQRLVRKIEEEKLRIRIIATSSTSDMFRPEAIHVGKREISSDLRTIVWQRINTGEYPYDRLRKLSKRTKQKLARNIEQYADSLLYVDQLLQFLGSLAREEIVHHYLDSMPANVTELYKIILERSGQQFSTKMLPLMKSVIMWLVFALRPLTLEELDAIAESEPGFNGDLTLEVFSPFFDIDYFSDDAAFSSPADVTALFAEPDSEPIDDTSAEIRLSNKNSQLKVKNETIRKFFSNASSTHDLSTRSSDAHLRMFLDGVSIILQQKQISSQSLREYVVEYSVLHWTKIEPDQHTDREQIEVCHTFARLMKDNLYAESLLKHSTTLPLRRILGDNFTATWTIWASCARKLPLDRDISDYWQRGENALWPLTKLLVRSWLRSEDSREVFKAWTLTSDTARYAGWKPPLTTISGGDTTTSGSKEYSETTSLAGILEVELDSNAHFAIGVVLAERGDTRSAIRELRIASDNFQETASRRRCYVQLASICNRIRDWSTALEYSTLVLPLLPPNPGKAIRSTPERKLLMAQYREAVKIREAVEISQSERIDILRIQGVALKNLGQHLGQHLEARQMFAEARKLCTDIVPVEYLLHEMQCGQELSIMMKIFLDDFSPIEHIHLLTANFARSSGTKAIPPVRLILPAMFKMRGRDEVIKMYKDAIDVLDAEQAGAPLKIVLASILWQSRSDIIEVKFLLDQVLDSMPGERNYKLTNISPDQVAYKALMLMSDILLEQFRCSKKVEEKQQTLLEAKDLLHRDFLAFQPFISSSDWNHYRLVIARMLQKIGPMLEYEQVMNKTFAEAIDALMDDTTINDKSSMITLSKVLMMMPSMRHFGKIIYAGRNYRLEANEDGKDSTGYDVDERLSGGYCDGICLPVDQYTNSDEESSFYHCLVCAKCVLCQSCHDLRMQWNADPEGEPATGLRFCCPNGRYVEGAVEGWRGVKNGVLYFDPPEGETEPKTIKFDQLLQDIRDAWKRTWEDSAIGI